MKNKNADLEFRYNPETFRIESNDPEIFVEVFGRPREGPFEAVVNIKEKKIGIDLETKREIGGDGVDYLSEWILENVFVNIFRHNESGIIERYCTGGKFKDLKEQEYFINLVKEAFSVYNATHDRPETKLAIEISFNLQKRLSNGRLIQ